MFQPRPAAAATTFEIDGQMDNKQHLPTADIE